MELAQGVLKALKDPAWLGALFGVLAVGTAVGIYLLQRQRKALTYEVLSRARLLTVREELANKLQVFYDGQPARDIRLIVLRFANSGNVPITPSDYEHPIRVSTGENSRIISADVPYVYPDNLRVALATEDAAVTIDPVLLNSHDAITLKLLVSDFNALRVDARIAGVTQVVQFDPDNIHWARAALVVVTFVVGVGMFWYYNPTRGQADPPMSSGQIIGLSIMAVVYGLMIVSTWLSRRWRRKIRQHRKAPRRPIDFILDLE